jgi:hypothetical protein
MTTETKGAPAPASSLAELHAVVALLSMMGLSDAERRPWEIITALVPWYAQAAGLSLDHVWSMPVADVVSGIRDHLPQLVSQERFTAASAEIARMVPQLQQMLRRP